MESSLRPMFILLAAMCVAKYATDYSRRGILNKLTES